MKILNLGWNNIGSSQTKLFADALYKLLQDDSLVHLDISHNGIKKDACSIISQGILNNHSLFGMHVEGNYCNIDPIGFIQPTNEMQGKHIDIRSNDYVISQNKSINLNKISCCSLCEGWSEHCIK